MIPANLNFDFSQGSMNQANHQAISTGYSALDVMLPHGGWPVAGITEIFCPESINLHFALPLIWPALAHLSQTKRWITLIAPPNAPGRAQLQSEGIDLSHVLMIHPHATTNGLWAVEQALRAGNSSAVISWVNNADHHASQDLRGAALAGNSCGLIFRPEWALEQPSAAALRLRVNQTAQGDLYVERMQQKHSLPHSAIFISPNSLHQTG